MDRMIIEVCAGSLADVQAARGGGADRVELNSALQLGGLTPSHALIEQAVNAFPGQVIVMIRPRPGGFVYSQSEWQTMLSDAEFALAAGASGIAFGTLEAGRKINVSRVKEIIRIANGAEVVFHRAFDLTSDWRLALHELDDLGVQRVMTSGQQESAWAGRAVIEEMIRVASSKRIQVLPAGGIRADNVCELLLATKASQIHGTFSCPAPDPDYELAGVRFSLNDQNRQLDPAELKRVVMNARPTVSKTK